MNHQLRLGLAGAAVLLAACDEPSGSRAGPPARLDVITGDGQRDTVGREVAEPLVVRVMDAEGRPVRGQLVNFRVTAGDGTVFAGSALTNEAGEARERWTLGTVAGDTQRVEARAVDPASGAPAVFATFRAVGAPDAPATLTPAVAGDLGGVPDTPVPNVAVRVADQHGNPVAGASVAWSVVSGGGTLSGTTTPTGAGGEASAEWRLGAVPGMQGVRAELAGLPAVQLNARLRLPGSLVVQSAPAAVAAGGSAEYRVLVRDSVFQPLPNTGVEWSLAGMGATLTPASARTAADGTARATLTVGAAQANFTIAARTGGFRVEVPVQVAGPIQMTELSTNGSRGHNTTHGGATVRIASSAGAITGATLTIGGRSAPMTLDAAAARWSGLVDLAGLPGGELPATIVATDVAGNTRTHSFTVLNDPNPTVTIVDPGSETVSARGSIRVRATCASYPGREPALCPTLYARVRAGSFVSPLTRGLSEIDVVVPLPSEPQAVTVVVEWMDARAVYYHATDSLTVNVTP